MIARLHKKGKKKKQRVKSKNKDIYYFMTMKEWISYQNK